MNERPWYVSMVLGVAAWFAGIFVLGFAWMMLEPLNTPQIAMTGTLLLIGACALFWSRSGNVFLDQLALAFWVAGQIAVAVSLINGSVDGWQVCAAVLALQVVLWAITVNALARLLAAFVACCMLALTIRLAFIDEDLFGDTASIALAPGLLVWAAAWLPVAAGAWGLVTIESAWSASRWEGAIRPALTGLLIALSVASICADPLSSLTFGSDIRANWLALWPLLDFGLAMVAMLLAYRIQNRAVVGIAIVAALIHVARLYFLLGVTLLTKSALLVIVGLAMLGAATWLERRVAREQP